MSEQYNVTVIIPVYNDEKYLSECIDSVIDQTLEEIEIICIDDGSSDRSLDIVNGYRKKYKYIRLLLQKHSGAGPARNLGIEAAQGKYIMFLDADDQLFESNTLERLYLSAESNDAFIVGGNIYIYDENGNTLPSKYIFSKNEKMSYRDLQECHEYQRFLYNRKLIIESGIRFPDYLRGQDPPFFMEIMSKAKEFYSINDIVYAHRVKKEGFYRIFRSEITLDALRAVWKLQG